MSEIRLNKYIANTGLCSRRKADEYIATGRVSINGKNVMEHGVIVRIGDKVCIDGKQLVLESRKVYIMLNKPRGYVTTVKEQFKRKSVLDIVQVDERVYPVGRLDMDSEGLLILTNDGDFTNNIIHPTKHIAKKYEVILRDKVKSECISKLEKGIDIGGYITRPASVEIINEKTINITIMEGKNRQVRRMCEAIGNRVINLKRVAIGNLLLGDLKTGEYIQLQKSDIEKIFE